MRLRVRFSKHGKVRFTSHRDVARIWERAVRRVRLPMAWSEGFSPRPKLHFGLALPTGYESDAEYLDLDLDLPTLAADELADLPRRLTGALPVGIAVAAARPVEPGTESLQAAVSSCSWTIELPGAEPGPTLADVERLLAADEVVVTRQRKGRDVVDDIRPYVIGLAAAGTDAGTELTCELGTHPRGLRPSELVAALGPGRVEGLVRRTHQWMQHDGARQEPLPLVATSAPHAQARAS